MFYSIEAIVREAVKDVGGDRTRLLDVARRVQSRSGCVSEEAAALISAELGVPRIEVDSLVSFYSFLSTEQQGRIVIRLSDDIVDRMAGYDRVAAAFKEELGIGMGETTPDGEFTLTRTACIGMCDQAPAALVNDVVVTDLSSDKVRAIVNELRRHRDPSKLVRKLGRGKNAHPLVQAMVDNHVRKAGPIVFSPLNRGEAVRKALAMSPVEVIRAVKNSRLRGRGGAGFPAGMKWEFTRGAPGIRKYVVCNADEGEPGTFKDRVLLTEMPDRVFAGMTIAGYAIGAQEGIVYLRAEYAYLKKYLDAVLEERRVEGLLGERIVGKNTLSFDIRIQLGAGAYVCGEETALISSLEGLRGDPKNRPPFPAQKGYRGYPTVVNNVETLCCVTRILEVGPASFLEYGSEQSAGTKLLSISGDTRRPGIYEVPFGTTLTEILEMAGAEDAIAVQVGGPSGRLVGPESYGRTICYEDLSTGGAMVVFGPDRDLLEVIHSYLEFFEDESCGYCTPCRVGNVLLKEGIQRIREGRGEPDDLDRFREIAAAMKATSRCGLGQTSSNPVISAMEAFPGLFDSRVVDDPEGFRRSFDLDAAVVERGGTEEKGVQS